MSTALRPELLPTADELIALRAVAAGLRRPDAIVRGGRVLAVHTGEFLERDVVVSGRHIAAITPVGRFDADVVVDAVGRHVVPTYIDAHLHIEYTMLTPGELARLSIPRGTTTVLTDADCLANVSGVAGLDFMLETTTPLRIFEQITPVTPVSPSLERGGAIIPDAVVRDRLRAPATVSLGESNPYDMSPEATHRFRDALAAGKRITGHTARMSDEALWGYLAAGVSDDHNAATADEAIERVRLGAMITVMAGSMNDNTVPLFADLEKITPCLGHMCFCADDKHALDLSTEGHIDHHVRRAIAAGIDPAQAYRMATWQPALYYRLDHLVGALTPGRLADLQVIDDLAEALPSLVMVGGEVVARDGRALFDNDDAVPSWVLQTMNVPEAPPAGELAVHATGTVAHVRAMQMYDGYFKREITAALPVVDEHVVTDPAQDVLKIAVIDRHHGDGLAGVGFVRGFGLTSGALAVTTNCTNMNIVAVGASDSDILFAVERLRDHGGGFVAVAGGRELAAVPLPVGGAMANAPWEQTAARLATAHEVARGMGCRIPSPFMILSFVGLGGVPELGLTERGLIDVSSQTLIDVLLAPDAHAPLCRCGHSSSSAPAGRGAQAPIEEGPRS
ncbi:adenine deaminase C-terminal domain-containing protein [Microbacterium rhizomatis]|uniref:Adenine deaminase n=1 Tax=Microbacterium rhizomatis TaxID=1631477 RepID=A0A5J5J013_9MICO|nr:adenine deaminase C-terminal domain-containing protein [Microbacterium rhizomatis]KAA9107982.1 adenine deaminase [Microbacterium rhizomatis]